MNRKIKLFLICFLTFILISFSVSIIVLPIILISNDDISFIGDYSINLYAANNNENIDMTSIFSWPWWIWLIISIIMAIIIIGIILLSVAIVSRDAKRKRFIMMRMKQIEEEKKLLSSNSETIDATANIQHKLDDRIYDNPNRKPVPGDFIPNKVDNLGENIHQQTQTRNSTYNQVNMNNINSNQNSLQKMHRPRVVHER